MKTRLALVAGIAALLLQAATASAQVSVTATAGPDPGPTAYATLGAAFTAVNAGTHQGAITIDIQASTSEGAVAAVLNSTGAGAAVYTSVLIRPTTDGVSISGASVSGRGIVELNGADSVTIDGDNPNTAGINRNLTIQNTAVSTTTFTSVVRVALSTLITTGNNNSVINTVITGSATGRNISAATSTTGSENTTYGILVGGGASTVLATTPPSAITSVSTTIATPITATNFVASNNRIDACARGIAMQGASTTVASGLTVTNNSIGSLTAGNTTTVYSRGMTLQGFDATTVAGNTVQNVESFIAAATMAVGLGEVTAVGINATVEKNVITNVFNQNTATHGAYGINVTAGNTITVRNNFVSNLNHVMSGGIAFSTTFGVFGIRVSSGTGHKVYHNSVNMFGVQPGTANSSLLTAAFAIVNIGQQGMDVRNNIFANTLSGGTTSVAHVSIYLPPGGTSAMNLTLNNNAYYSGTDPARQGLAQVGTTPGTTFFLASNFNACATTPASNFRSYSSILSAAGTNDNVSFATTNAAPFTTTTDLHIPNGTLTLLESGGVGTATTGVTTDIDGEVRPNGVAPDIGADEFTGALPAANDIAATAIVVPATGSIFGIGSTVTPQASFQNVGSATQTSVGVQFTISGPSGYAYSSPQTIASICPGQSPGQTVTVTFAAAPPFSTTGIYNVSAAVTTPDAGPANDVVTGSFEVKDPVAGGSHSVPGEFPSLTNPGGIFAALNAVGASGNVTIEITADLAGETGAVALNELAGGFSVTIKPVGAPRTITGSNATNGIIRLNGADNVTMDGSLTGGTASGTVGGDPTLRNLTIQNTSTALTSAVISVHSGPNGAQNNTFRNLNVLGQDPTQTFVGISIGGATPGTAGTDNDNTHVENCSVQKAVVGIYHVGASAANPNTGSILTMNDLAATGANRVRRVGIFVFNDNGGQVTLNTIGGIDTNEALDAIGIVLGIQNVTTTAVTAGGITNVQVLRNRINGVFASSTTGFSAAGIALAGSPGGANVIANNMIAGVIAPSTSPDIVAGIFVAGVTGASTQVFYNSIENTGDRGAVANQINSFGIAITGVNPVVTLRDNVFLNSQTSSGGINAKSFSIGMQSTTFTNLDSDFNDFFVSGANGILARTGNLEPGGADIPTLAAWQTAVSDDANSLNVDPLFVSTTDPHLQGASPVKAKGTPVAGITNDFDGDPRDAVTPEIGADEIAEADLSTTKVGDVEPVVAGTNLTYTITVANAGAANAANASLSDTVPAGTTFVSLAVPAGWSCTTPPAGGTGAVSCTNPLFSPGNAVFTLVVAVDPALPAGSVISNTAAASSTTADPNAANNNATANTNVAAVADLATLKTDSPDPVTAGQDLTYTITVANGGPSFATAASLGDPLPAGTTFVSLASAAGWSCTTPPVGGTGSVDCTSPSLGFGNSVFTLVVKVDASVPDGTVLTNTASAASATADPNGANNSASATSTVAGSADLSVVKTDSPDPVAAGGDLTYTITATNAGPSIATTVTVGDALPAGTTFVSLSSPAGWSCTTPPVGGTGAVNCTNPSVGTGDSVFTLVVKVDAGVTAGTVLTNTATAASSTADPNAANNSGTATTTVAASADLSVIKTDSPDPVTAGSDLTYTITTTNAGPSIAATVTLDDPLPTGTTFVSLAAPAGWSCTTPPVGGTGTVHCTNPSVPAGDSVFTLIVNVDTGVIGGTLLTNTATAASSTADPDPANNSGSAATAVAGSADLSVVKTDSPDPVTVGGNLTYTITATNAGPSNAASATLDDTLPPGTTFVSLSSAAGWSCTAPPVGGTGAVSCTNPSLAAGDSVFTLVVKVDAGVTPGTVLTNTATAASSTTDPNPGNESGTATTTVAGAADLSVVKTDSPDPVTVGSTLTYTITAGNAGPSSAASVTLDDTLPPGTTFVSLAPAAGWSCTTPPVGGTGAIHCSNPAVATGSSIFTLIVKVDASVPAGTVLTNTAVAASTTADPNPGNESATATTTVAGLANVEIDMDVDNPAPGVGTNVTFTIDATNNGPSAATNIKVTDKLPRGLTFVTAVPTQGTYDPATGLWDIGAMALTEGGTATLAVVATVTLPDSIVNEATKTAQGEADPDPSNNVALVVLNGAPQADIQVNAAVDNATPATGSNVTLTVTATNGGPADATGVEITDLLPTGLTFVSATPSQGTYTPGTGVWTVGSVANGASATLQIVATVTTGGSLSDIAAKTAEVQGDLVTLNDSSSVTLNDATVADLALSKTASQEPVAQGANFTYMIATANLGPAAASNVTVTDVLPAGVTLVSATSSQGSCSGTTTVTCALGTLSPGGSAQMFILVTKNVGGDVSNTAGVAADQGDPNPVNNSSSTSTTPVELLSIQVE
jgi:uncharacterized repeat protein (TIGR01451 family)